MEDATSADQGVAIGSGAALDVTTNQNFVVIGYNAGQNQVDSCVYIGSRAGQDTTGNGNTFVGDGAGRDATSVSSCTFIGNGAGAGISSATKPTGDNNVAVGDVALFSLQNGDDNTAIGSSAGGAVTGGDGNTFVGKEAGLIVTTGDNNVTIGYQAGDELTTGSNNIILGANTSASSATVSNEITLGDSNIATLRCNVQTISTLSDARDKTDIQELPEGLAFIDSLNPVKFQWQTRDGNGKDGTYEAGFIAQQLQSAQSRADADYLGLVMDENPDRLEASYGKLVPMLVKAIQELKSEVEQLKANAA